MEDHALTEGIETNNISPLAALGVTLKGIYPKGVCPTCKGPFRWDRQRGYICPDHGASPHRFIVLVGEDKGKKVRRETSLDGHALHTYGDALALRKQIENERKSGRFDIEKWKAKDKGRYHPGRLVLRWYKDKLRALRRGDLRPSYIRALRQYIKLYFIPFGVDRHLMNIRDIQSTKDFFDWLPDRLSPKYRKNIKLAVATFFHWVKDELRLIDEMPHIPAIKVPKKAPEVLSMDVRRFIVDNFILPAHRPIFGYYINQGCRPGELIALKWDSIKDDPAHGRYVIYLRTMSEDTLIETTKDSESRVNPIFPETEKYLPARSLSPWVFTNRGQQYTVSVLRHQLYWAFRRYNKHMAIAAEKQGKTWEPVSIPLYNFGKHSWSSERYAAGHSLTDIQHYHGHSKAETSLIYTQIDVLNRFKVKPIEIKKAKNK